MPEGPAPDERLRNLAHLDRRLHPGLDTDLLERVLQREAVDHRRQHAHLIADDAVDPPALAVHAAEDVSPADHDGDLRAHVPRAFHAPGHGRDYARVNAQPGALVLQRLSAELENDSAVLALERLLARHEIPRLKRR